MTVINSLRAPVSRHWINRHLGNYFIEFFFAGKDLPRTREINSNGKIVVQVNPHRKSLTSLIHLHTVMGISPSNESCRDQRLQSGFRGGWCRRDRRQDPASWGCYNDPPRHPMQPDWVLAGILPPTFREISEGIERVGPASSVSL